MMSDAWPIFGYRRSPYVVIFGALGTVAWLWLGLDTSLRNLAFIGTLLWFANLSQAGPDVMIDATNAERVVTHPALASDLQSLSWGMLGVFGVLAGLTEGLLQSHFGSRGVFLACSLTAAAVALPAGLGWLKEDKVATPTGAVGGGPCGSCRAILNHPQQAPVFHASICVSIFSLFLGK
jgi:hypothetical protein